MKERVHLIGIGGIGMSALARWFCAHSWQVSGSDITATDITNTLRDEGIKVLIGCSSKNISAAVSLVITSQAISSSNPEVIAASKFKIPVLSYPEMLGAITRASTTIAIAGSHGKSTTTALTSLIFMYAKRNPTVIVGTLLKEFGNLNFHAGSEQLLIMEADEYGKAFFHYSPTIVAVTNIDREHLDIYPTMQSAQRAFLTFLSHTKPGGTLVLNRDNPPLYTLSHAIQKLSKKNNLTLYWYSLHDAIAKEVRKHMTVVGEHNISNALAAFVIATRVAGISKKDALRALSLYQGTWRRMEYRGDLNMGHGIGNRKVLKNRVPNSQFPIRVFDDYAHHPTEIKATLDAFRAQYPNSPLVCVFQPHQTLRLRKLFKEFIAAVSGADALVLLPAYQVSGRDKNDLRFTSKTLAVAIQEQHPDMPVTYVSHRKRIKQAILSIMHLLPPATSHKDSPTVVMMGAGDIVNCTKTLLI
ncbi:MAG: UDP-N-acetylmuramate--L-alanine ligase [Patescibacteria group bacterium]|nr:UDP-N-acetylmuramate--L-alanine ligase [Patescibacteria group bacterium]